MALVKFYDCTMSKYNEEKAKESFYNQGIYFVTQDTVGAEDYGKTYLYIGKDIISSDIKIPVVDQALNVDSTNAIANKAVTAAIADAKEVFTKGEPLKKGKFFYTSDFGTKSLEFSPDGINLINLLPTSDYSAEDTTLAVTGKAVAKAIQDNIEVIVSKTAPTAPVKGKFYLVTPDSGEEQLLFYPDGVNAIDLVDTAPMNHASAENKYGATAQGVYGHAKSGLDTVSETGKTLVDSYIDTNSALDKNLVGSNITNFARVDHKHAFPHITGVLGASSSDQKTAAVNTLITADTFTFISKSAENAYKMKDGKVISANDRLIELESATDNASGKFISKTATQAQSVASDLIAAKNLTVGSELIVNTIKSSTTGTSTPQAINVLEAVAMAKGLTISGVLTASSNATVAGTLGVTGVTTLNGLAQTGNVQLGKGNNVTALNITASTASVTGSAVFAVPVSGTSATFTNITGTNTNAGALTATSFSLSNAAIGITTLTTPIGTLSKRLTTAGEEVLYKADLTNSTGEIAKHLNTTLANYILKNNIVVLGTATDATTIWTSSVIDDIHVPSMAAIDTYLKQKYQAKGNYQIAGSYVTTASVQDSYIPTDENPISGKGVAAALANFSTQAYHAGTTAPSNVSLLWIDTNLGNGVIKYHDGTTWVATSAVWS